MSRKIWPQVMMRASPFWAQITVPEPFDCMFSDSIRKRTVAAKAFCWAAAESVGMALIGWLGLGNSLGVFSISRAAVAELDEAAGAFADAVTTWDSRFKFLSRSSASAGAPLSAGVLLSAGVPVSEGASEIDPMERVGG